MKKNRRGIRPRSSRAFHGNAWSMPTAAAAKATYDTLLKRLLDRDPEDWSLVSGFFQNKPVLAFLWDPNFNAELVESVARLAASAGGEELEDEAKQTLLTQLSFRRRGLQAKENFESLVIHHPKAKPFWDLDD